MPQNNVMSSVKQTPRVILELEMGHDPAHSQIQIRHENMPQGWVTVVQMLHQALGAVLPQAFAQILEQGQQQDEKKRIVFVQGMGDLRR